MIPLPTPEDLQLTPKKSYFPSPVTVEDRLMNAWIRRAVAAQAERDRLRERVRELELENTRLLGALIRGGPRQ